METAVVFEVLEKVSDKDIRDLNALLPKVSREPVLLTRTRLKSLIDGPGEVLVGRVDGQIVGCLYLAIVPILSGVKAWAEDIVVDESARGKGVASGLIRMAVEHARKRACKHINLTARDDRPDVQAMYDHLGFDRRAAGVWRIKF